MCDCDKKKRIICCRGPRGFDGEEGPQGPVGEKGAKGEQGIPGGSTGPKGPVGDKGPDGMTGEKGQAGDKGPDGMAGEKGEAGDKGPDGMAGDKGPVGEKGEAGEKGPDGMAGEKGQPGDKGPDGMAGEKGQPGDKGPDGMAGEKGQAGDKGPDGMTGEKGEAGDKGPDGMVGEKGQAGDKGPDGLAGEKGQPGDKGQPGETGPQGPVGEKGQPGDKGPAGEKGQPGESGNIIGSKLLCRNFTDNAMGGGLEISAGSNSKIKTFYNGPVDMPIELQLILETGTGGKRVALRMFEAPCSEFDAIDFGLTDPYTFVSSLSDGVSLPTGTINVSSTSDFPSSGTLLVNTSAGVQTVNYAGRTSTSFTGCTGGVGSMETGSNITGSPAPSVLSIGSYYGSQDAASGYICVKMTVTPTFPDAVWQLRVDPDLGENVLQNIGLIELCL